MARAGSGNARSRGTSRPTPSRASDGNSGEAMEGAVERWIRRQTHECLGRLGAEEDHPCNLFGIPPSEDPDVLRA
jgi:hypothetical protein